MTKIAFTHIQTAHCENGVTANLLKHHGVDFITEPLAFGIGSGLFYIKVPFLKVNHGPAISFRTMPGAIFSRTCKALNIQLERKKYTNQDAAMRDLDKKIDEGVLVGCQVGVYYLPYFPKAYRFHFNAHNLLVYGNAGDEYNISDPVMESTTTINKNDLKCVRFAKGPLAPRGQMYYPVFVPVISKDTIADAIKKGIKRNIRDMVTPPVPMIGINGIKQLSRLIKKWPIQLGEKKTRAYLGQVIRMQEEIGTGGGGFRFLFAAFLEEAYDFIPNDQFLKISEKFTAAGDLWRESAVQMAGLMKGRLSGAQEYNKSAEIVKAIAEKEKEAFLDLKKLKL